ncbi:MAG: MFS transporter [Chlamydiales bacterium]|nr:MFS transporter [Chlamydiales bacterium]
MHSLFRLSIAPLLSIAILMLGSGYYTTFISMRLYQDGQGAFIIGLVQGAYYAGFLIGALKIEALMHRIRHIRAYAFFTCICTAIVLLQGLYIHPYAWVIERFIMGLCIASLYVVIESWLLIIAPESSKGTLLSFYMIALYCSQALSQFLVDFLNPRSMTPFIVTAIFSSLSMMPATFTYTHIPEQIGAERATFLSILKKSPFGAWGCIVAGMILSSLYSFVPTFAERTGLSVSYAMSLMIAGGFLLQWPLGYLSDIFDRRKILILVSILTVLPCAGIMLLMGKAKLILGLIFLLGGFTFTLYPLSITHVTDRHKTHDLTSITAVMLFAYSTGSVVGPLVAPFFINMSDTMGLFIYIGIMAGILSVVGLVSAALIRPVPKAEQGDFVPLPGQSTLSYELDPRSSASEDEAKKN